MNQMPDLQEFETAPLSLEWLRVGQLVALAEAMRTGDELPEGFGDALSELGAAIGELRSNGAWAGLAQVVDRDLLSEFWQIDIDLLVLALAADARPSLAPRLQSLQPQVGAPNPSLALAQELLMLEDNDEVSALYSRLEPTAPLVASGLIRITGGDGPYQLIRATRAAQRAVFGRVTDITPPPGANLETRRGTWGDLVLPDATMRSLKDFAAWLKHRDRITEWGGRVLGGPLALFSGGSGTGKSFAASVIAAEISHGGEPWALYTLDLGRIMSKYVGETEENLNKLLDALDGRRAVLQIDEADGLLGKRGEISDARDRYANLEVSHMLSRFERHNGPVILTTNLRTNIDSAFLRRFQLVIDFPSPDVQARARLWSKLLPPNAPRAKDVDLDTLAASARLSGGAILNAAQYATILAADNGGKVTGEYLARAVWAELAKENRQIRKSEIGALGVHLEEEA